MGVAEREIHGRLRALVLRVDGQGLLVDRDGARRDGNLIEVSNYPE
jgi:hypothetical protein